jgi:ABC-type multidrug transport system ATPase subunit/CRP-like cAMP-binding protein
MREQLRRVPLFKQASEETLNRMTAALTQVSVPGGAVVCRQGEPGATFHLVELGTLVVESEVGSQRRELARMGPGDFFGEIALLGSGTRTATVTALSPSRLWTLTADDFAAVTTEDPALRAAVQDTAQERLGRSMASAFEVRHRTLGEMLAKRGKVAVGRAVDNDIVLPSRLVSNHHAVLRAENGTVLIEDLGSTNGTFLNARPVRSALLHDGDEVWFADELFVFQVADGPDGAQLTDVSRPRGVRIDAIGLHKVVGDGKDLLQDVSLSVLPGELVALVGGSGAGKTTLLDALAGIRPASAGRVLYDGNDRYQHDARFRSTYGYVPQDDIVHTQLPLRRTLLHAANVRLPADASEESRAAAVDNAISQLGLNEQAGVKVASLSGGQRKRSSIAVELLTEPRLFFLDEPTSGLDPATDAHTMRLLRRIADAGSTVLVTTHATKSVSLCDKVVVLARGGHLAFVGSPSRALEHFGVAIFDEIYDRLEPEEAPAEAAAQFTASPEYEQQQAMVLDPPAPDSEAGGAKPKGRLRRSLHQLAALSRRNLDIHLHNKDLLIPVAAQPLTFSVLLLALFNSGLFDPGNAGASGPLQLVFLLAFNAFLLGLLTSVQEIVKELPIFFRERSVGVGAGPYLLSKISFLLPAVVIGNLVLMGVPWLTNRLPHRGLSMLGPLLLTLLLASLAGMALGLFTSALVSTSQAATDMLSLWIVPQVLFGGGLFAVPAMNFAWRVVANIAGLRWAFEAAGHAVGLSDVFRNSGSNMGRSMLEQYGDSFDHPFSYEWSILAVFVLVPMTAALLILRSRQPKR